MIGPGQLGNQLAVRALAAGDGLDQLLADVLGVPRGVVRGDVADGRFAVESCCFEVDGHALGQTPEVLDDRPADPEHVHLGDVLGRQIYIRKSLAPSLNLAANRSLGSHFTAVDPPRHLHGE